MLNSTNYNKQREKLDNYEAVKEAASTVLILKGRFYIIDGFCPSAHKENAEN